MDLVRRIVFIGRSLRNETKIKVRQPLSNVVVVAKSAKRKNLIQGVEHLITEELNVKGIKFVSDEKSLITRRAEPLFKSLGPKFGKAINQAVEAIRSFSDQDIQKLLDAGDERLVVDGHEAKISPDDIKILTENKPGLVVETEGDLTVALETDISDELLYEGLAREFVNRVQNMRKDAGFEVTDRINIWVQASPKFSAAIKKMLEYIRNETLAQIVNLGELDGSFKKDWKIGNEIASIGITKI